MTTARPDHWHWRDGPVEPGPAVVFDIDGVLSDAAGRQHYLERPWRDWDAFFDAVRRGPAHRGGGPPPRRCSTPTLRIVLLTARPMQRPAADARRGSTATSSAGTCSSCATGATTAPPATSSSDAVHDLRTYGFDLRLAFEDDRRNVEMFHREGIPCVYIHSGYYD